MHLYVTRSAALLIEKHCLYSHTGFPCHSLSCSARGRGLLRGFLELRRPWGFSHEARRGSQGATRAARGKSGLHERGEGERVIVLESWEGCKMH